jgi:uncharacterized protein (UPF0276 family)
MIPMDKMLPILGFGLGLRASHYPYIFEQLPQVDWFEIISENFMDTDGRPKRNLSRIAEHYPIVMHGVGLSIANINPLNSEYLEKLKRLMDWIQPVWISDHVCWTGNAHANSHDLLPIPYTEEALKHITTRIHQVQDFLGRPIALENPSSYLEFKSSSMSEAEFISRMVEDSGCFLLLDVNNVYVTCYNHRLDPKTYLDTLPMERVIQIHLSGHTHYGTHIIDTHDDHVVDEVWALYHYVIQQAGRIPNTMIEWDGNIPEFPVVYAELEKAKAIASSTQCEIQLPRLAQPRLQAKTKNSRSLEAEQQCMQQSILPGESFDSHVDKWIYPKEEFTPLEQLEVYVNAYRSRLYEVTAEDYPVLKQYLGDELFNELMTHFIRTHRSDHFNIGRFAAKLPAFLAQYWPQEEFAYELCTLEKAISQLADPEETLVLNSNHLADLSPEMLMELVLYPRKALELFAFKYPVNAYFCAVKEEQALPELSLQKTWLVVFRHEDSVWRMELESREYKMLQLLFSGLTIGAVLESMETEKIDREADTLNDLYAWFGRWIRNGLLSYNEKEMPLLKKIAA